MSPAISNRTNSTNRLLAQLVARSLDMGEVTGSSPVETTKLYCNIFWQDPVLMLPIILSFQLRNHAHRFPFTLSKPESDNSDNYDTIKNNSAPG